MTISFTNTRVIKRENVLYTSGEIHIDDRVAAKEEEYIEKTFKKAKENIDKKIETYHKQQKSSIEEELKRYKEEEKEQILKEAEERVYNRIYSELDKQYKKEYESKIEEAKKIVSEANLKKKEVEREISNLRRKWLKENEEDIIKILISSTKKIIGETMEVNSQTVSEILSNTIKEVDDHSKKIWVSVSEEANVMLQRHNYSDQNIEIIVDPNLKNLDVIIKSDDKLIDGTISKKVERLEEVLREWLDESGPYKD